VAGRAFILGGTGQIGRAVSRALTEAGWEVTTGQRGFRDLTDSAGVRRVHVDRSRSGELEEALGDGADVLIDVVAYDATDAQQLLSISDVVGSLITISSASVYRDEAGRTIDEAADEESFPRFPRPIGEEDPTVEPGETTYSTKKVAMERTLLEGASIPVTVIRPGAIHGPGTQHAREWYFLKRALDARHVVIHSFRGENVFHTTSVSNLAELIRLAAEQPATRILNCGDPHPPNVLRIARAVWQTVHRTATEVLVPGGPPAPNVGESPWTAPRSLVLNMARAASELGYAPLTDYESAVGETCAWLIEATEGQDWKNVLPDLARYPGNLFDYDAEDTILRRLGCARA
jgi:nucleoside-diphosphate-sugar epimerase